MAELAREVRAFDQCTFEEPGVSDPFEHDDALLVQFHRAREVAIRVLDTRKATQAVGLQLRVGQSTAGCKGRLDQLPGAR
jgi:hypothetical protein